METKGIEVLGPFLNSSSIFAALGTILARHLRINFNFHGLAI